MRRLLRSPLTWMIAAEVVAVSLLVAVAWQLVTAVHTQGAVPATAGAAGRAVQPVDAPDLQLPVVSTLVGPAPGLNVAAAFWRARLADLNRDESLFVQLEWRVVGAAESAVKRYLETVVLPAVRRAERARGSR